MKPIATVKCPYCIGLTNNSRNTLYLYATDSYWCARCKTSGVISDLSPETISGITPKLTQPKVTQFKQYNNKGDRFSVCKQRHFDGYKDVFQVKLFDGTVVGHYSRLPGKVNNIEGTKAFCYRETHLQLGGTYRLVEGVYDCVYPNDVALLGFPNKYQVNQLKWAKLILCPDGDVWTKRDLFLRWFEPFIWSTNIVGVERLPNNLDPDECQQSERIQIKFNEVKQKWFKLKEQNND